MVDALPVNQILLNIELFYELVSHAGGRHEADKRSNQSSRSMLSPEYH